MSALFIPGVLPSTLRAGFAVSMRSRRIDVCPDVRDQPGVLLSSSTSGSSVGLMVSDG